MNAQTKNKIRELAQSIGQVFSGFSATLSSILRMFFLSSVNAARKSGKHSETRLSDSCSILANGPSLKQAIIENKVRLDGNDVFCMNSFCESEYFWTIKPRYYCLIDGQFFHPTLDRCTNQVERLIECIKKVDWDMYLVIPSYVKYGNLKKTAEANPHINILQFNSTDVGGYKWFRNLMYKLRMGMPKCINVSIFAIMSAINMKYKHIYLYGVDHTFSAQLFVNEDNIVCSREAHVYSQEPKITEIPETTITRILTSIALCFGIHELLCDFSVKMGVEIINCTKGSFIDAYKREK